MPVESSGQILSQAVTSLKSQIATKNFPNNRQLIEICKKYFINLIDVKNEPHRIHDILETAVNLHLFVIRLIRLMKINTKHLKSWKS